MKVTANKDLSHPYLKVKREHDFENFNYKYCKKEAVHLSVHSYIYAFKLEDYTAIASKWSKFNVPRLKGKEQIHTTHLGMDH